MHEEENKKPAPAAGDAQQQLNTPSTDEPIVPVAETTTEAEQQPSTLNPVRPGHPGGLQPLNPDMEVHHHAHDPAAPHHKKNWKSYFWEFLMLFLAVLCGFFAEYQLEHKIERDREKQFMQTMIEDLKTDSAQLSRLIASRKKRIRELDTLFNLIASDEYLTNGKKVYMLYEIPYWDVLRFFPSDRTMLQLKNGGNLRLIRKRNVSNALIKYDVWIRNRKEYEPLQSEVAGQFNLHIEKLLDPVVLNEASSAFTKKQLQSDTNVTGFERRNLPSEIKMQSLTAADKKIFLKYIYEIKTLYLALRRDNLLERELAEETLALIIKEYHLN